MEYIPVFMNLSQREVFLCGSGAKAVEKLELLRSFGGKLTLFSFVGEAEGAETHSRPLRAEDLDRLPALVVTACDEEEDARVSALCRERGIPVNAVDRPVFCTFFFPAMVRTNRLCVAIGTGGASPGAAAELKRRVAASIPEDVDSVLDWLSGLRAKVYGEEADRGRARLLLRDAARQALELGRTLTEEELEQLNHDMEGSV